MTNERAFRKELGRLKVPSSKWPEFSKSEDHATTHFLEMSRGRKIAIVCKRPSKRILGIQIAALLVHEAVHIWQAVREELGEREPSSEFEAYSIQRISQQLFHTFAKTRGRH